MRPLVVVNPVAGSGTAVKLAEDFVARLAERGIEATLVHTEYSGHARDLGRGDACEQCSHVVVVGGDGTVMELLTGLREAKRIVPVLQLPAGTANVLASVVTFPATAEEAVQVLSDDYTVEIDLGYAKSHHRYFAVAAGAGYDAAIIRGATRALKNRLGFFAYLVAALNNLWRLRSVQLEVSIDGDRRFAARAHTVIVSNAGLEGDVGLPLGPSISHIDGLLDLLVVERASPLSIGQALWYALRRKFARAPGLVVAKGTSFRIKATPPLEVQIDGDLAGQTPLEVEVHPRAARVLTAEPRDALPHALR
jgi:YegS/Rv2252/BmrU family lipid kinase